LIPAGARAAPLHLLHESHEAHPVAGGHNRESDSDCYLTVRANPLERDASSCADGAVALLIREDEAKLDSTGILDSLIKAEANTARANVVGPGGMPGTCAAVGSLRPVHYGNVALLPVFASSLNPLQFRAERKLHVVDMLIYNSSGRGEQRVSRNDCQRSGRSRPHVRMRGRPALELYHRAILAHLHQRSVESTGASLDADLRNTRTCRHIHLIRSDYTT
jgi:hypothetical protein